MSALTEFRDHARRMATAEHKPECCRCGMSWCCGCVDHPAGKPWGWAWMRWEDHRESCPGNPSAKPCPGCLTAADRAIWLRLADEIDAYLAGPPESVDLFGNTGVEPAWEDA